MVWITTYWFQVLRSDGESGITNFFVKRTGRVRWFSMLVVQSRPCAYVAVDPTERVSVAGSAVSERPQLVQAAERAGDIAYALLRPAPVEPQL